MKIQLLMTGNELMVGDIIDSNSAMIAKSLKQIGHNVCRKVTVADDFAMLVNEIKDMTQQAEVLIINGGLGPTVDDLTAEALARAADLPIATHEKALAHLQAWGQARNQQLTKANLKQAELPKGCNIIPNPVGSAVGFSLSLNNCQVYCTPGVPRELELMLNEQLIPDVDTQTDSYLTIKRFSVFGIGESALQELIDQQIPQWPSTIALGFRAASPLIELKLTCTNKADVPSLELLAKQLKSILQAHIIEEVQTQPRSLAQVLVELLTSRQEIIATAESCTGGLIASLLTEVSGSSAVFEAGFVTYSNRMKEHMVGVNHTTLAQHGAVSESVVREMVQGAIRESGSKYGVAVSGIAGPTGGSIDKPVGTVWIAWGTASDVRTQKMLICGERKYFQNSVAYRTLDLIRRFILNDTTKPHYTKRLV
ncbi:CinA family nicotinamide mononucleotide deamidase-related protein [Thalassotalea fusca]